MKALRLSLGDRPLKILCLGAHSDDIEIGAGATLLTLTSQYRETEITWVVMSAMDERAKEAQRGAELFAPGAEVQLEEFPDGRFPMHLDRLKETFADLGRRCDPDVVFTHTEYDRHQDHRAVSELTWQTWRDHLILEYEIPKFDGDLRTPNAYVEVDRATVDLKARLLEEAFDSQTSKPWFGAETFRGLMRIRGVECRAASGFAEGFHMRKTRIA